MSYTGSVARHAALFLVVTGLGSVVFYVWRLLLAHELQPAEVGLFFAVFSLVGLITGIKDFGTSSAAVKYVAQYRTERKWELLHQTLIWTLLWQLSVFVIGAIVVIVLAKYLAASYFKDLRAVSLIMWIALLGLLTVFENFFFMTFQGFRAIAYYSFMPFLRGLFLLVVTFFLLRFGLGVSAPAVGYVLALALVLVICVVWVRRVHPDLVSRIPKLEWKQFERIAKFSIPVTVGVVGSWVFAYADTLVLTLLRSLTEVGFFTVAQPLAGMMHILPKSLSVVIFPLSSELHALRDSRLVDGVKRVQKYLMAAMLPVGLVIVVFAKPIINILFPPEYAVAAPLLQLLTVAQVLNAVATVNHSILLGVGRPKAFAMVMVGGAGTLILLDLALAAPMGLVGIGIANVAAQFVMLGLSAWKIRDVLPGTAPIRSWLKCTMAGIIMLVLMMLIKNVFSNVYISIIFTATAGAAVYVMMVFALRIINFAEIMQLFRAFLNRS